jgi:hypothetical protein
MSEAFEHPEEPCPGTGFDTNSDSKHQHNIRIFNGIATINDRPSPPFSTFFDEHHPDLH